MPAQLGALPRESFHVTERDTGSDFGNFSRSWRYRLGNRVATVSIDYPFRGWHELTECYRGVGWNLHERAVRTRAAGACVEATFTQPEEQPAVLLFGLDDQRGEPLEPRFSGSMLAYLRNRLAFFNVPPEQLVRRLASRHEAMPRGYQVQVLLEADTPLSTADRVEAQKFFDEIRESIRQTIFGAVKSKAKRGAP